MDTQMNMVVDEIPVYIVELVAERMLPGPQLTGPEGAARFAQDYLRRSDREVFIAIMLATSGRVVAVHTVSVGSVNASIVRPADAMRAAVLSNAVSVVFAHNHPSGTLEPSAEDIQVTRRLVEAGRLLDIRVLDSIIVSPDGGFTSLAERGLVG